MSERASIAFYVTPHGLGHATRAFEIILILLRRGHSVVLVSGSAVGKFVAQQLPSECKRLLTFRRRVLDSGALQPHAFTVDPLRSLEEYNQVVEVHRESHLESEASWLRTSDVDVVVSDVVPIACAAASLAGVQCVCVSNFSWDFIFAEYSAISRQPEFAAMVRHIAEDYAKADVLLRLPGHSPMPAFRHVVDVPLVVRHARMPAQQVREQLGVPSTAHMVTFMFGAHVLNMALRESWLPPGWLCVICSGGNNLMPSDEPLPPNFVLAPADAYVPDVIAASDCVIGKIGYGSVAECLAHGTPLIHVRRDHFNEEPFLRQLLQAHGGVIEIRRADMLTGNWAAYLERALDLRPQRPSASDGAEVCADHIERLANDAGAFASTHGAAAPLQDRVVYGFVMAGHGAPAETSEGPPEAPAPAPSELPASCTIHHSGLDPSTLPADTRAFLHTLSTLSAGPDGHQLPERRAAATMFDWRRALTVTRAPGRLDVMGGIADYSGSLVLQMPIAQACHVALQRQGQPGEQRLWRHIEVRQGARPQPVVRVVSLHAENANRAPTFDMDLGELFNDGQPKAYADLQRHFRDDPSTRWAAYVVGALLVLMREAGVRFEESIAIFVSSDVPEGKGVSSSAAVEVATMQALNAAFDIGLEGSELARLCQKVENLVVGAPCGIMDQMASALGRENELLALCCQPAQVVGSVPVPQHMRFWGIDSGITHSVGGSDYGAVRVGAFMGRAILRSLLASPPLAPNVSDASSTAEYLCHVSPSEWLLLEDRVPNDLTGAEFAERFGSHGDDVTTVAPSQRYAVRRPTEHPIWENHRVHVFHQLLLASGSRGRALQALTSTKGALLRSIQSIKESACGPTDSAVQSSVDDAHANQLQALGELMLQSHASYSRCGLGSSGTDRLMELVRRRLPQPGAGGGALSGGGVFGAKITGGGSGGTVAVLATNDAAGAAAVQEVVTQYTSETQHAPVVISASSMGAMQFGYMEVDFCGVDANDGPVGEATDAV